MLVVIRRAVDRLISLAAAVAAAALVAEVIVILADVTGRAFGSPLYGSQDLITMAMVLLVFGGIALCDRRNGHIAVDIFESHFPPTMNRAIDIVSALLGAAIFIFIAWTVWESAKLSQMLNLSTNLLRLPKAWFQWGICLFSVLTALTMLLKVVEMFGRRAEDGVGEPAE